LSNRKRVKEDVEISKKTINKFLRKRQNKLGKQNKREKEGRKKAKKMILGSAILAS